MNKKNKTLWGLGAVALAGVAAGIYTYRQNQLEKRKARRLAEVRESFEELGEIAAFYIYEQESTADSLSGGVVLEDGTSYLFELEDGQLIIEEEEE